MSLSTVTPAVTRWLPTPPILPPGHCGSFSGHFSLSLSSPPAKFIMKFLSLSAHIDKRVPPRVGSVVCLFLLSLQLSQDGCQHPLPRGHGTLWSVSSHSLETALPFNTPNLFYTLQLSPAVLYRDIIYINIWYIPQSQNLHFYNVFRFIILFISQRN